MSEQTAPIGRNYTADVAYDFVRYYVAGSTGCRNCGGLPHSSECFVGKFIVALALDSLQPAASSRTGTGERAAPLTDAQIAEHLHRILSTSSTAGARVRLLECLAMARAPAAEPWQPIATAPKDAHILAVVDGQVRIVRYGKTSHVPLYGFCLADQGAEDFDLCNPTLWMPLPPAPCAPERQAP